MKFNFCSVIAFFVSVAVCVGAAAVKDPETLKIRDDLNKFCKGPGKGEGKFGKKCFTIRTAFIKATLAKAAKSDPCGRRKTANDLVANFGDAAAAIAIRMDSAKINSLKSKGLDGGNVACNEVQASF